MLRRIQAPSRALVRCAATSTRLFGEDGAARLPAPVRIVSEADLSTSDTMHHAYHVSLTSEVGELAHKTAPQAAERLAGSAGSATVELPRDGRRGHHATFLSLAESASAESIRTALGSAARSVRVLDGKVTKASEAPCTRTAVICSGPALGEAAGGHASASRAMTQAVILGDDDFDTYKSSPAGGSRAEPLSFIAIAPSGGAAASDAVAEAERAAAVASGCVLARRVAAERADVAHPAGLEAVAEAIVAEARSVPGLRAEIRVLRGEEDLLAHDMRLFAAVGQAAGRARPETHAPRLIEIVLSRGEAAGEAPAAAAMLGKAVCFDSGGLNLKPTGSIETMHMDKGGGAAVLGAALATVRAGGPPNDGREYVFAVAACENAIGSHAYKPHAVIRSAKGTTVEVGNTDAEGRLVLVDAMTRLQATRAPGALVDVATLTGACVVALGSAAAGLFSNSDGLASALLRAGDGCGEPLWRLPIMEEHREALRHGQADMRSTGKGRGAGSSTAAAFLEHFVEDGVSWAHLDIAGAGMRDSARGMHPAGATGHGSQCLAEWVLSGDAGEAAGTRA